MDISNEILGFVSEIHDSLRARGETLSTAESLTAGGLSNALTGQINLSDQLGQLQQLALPALAPPMALRPEKYSLLSSARLPRSWNFRSQVNVKSSETPP